MSQIIKHWVNSQAGITWVAVAGDTIAAAVNCGYFCTNIGKTTLTLPPIAAVGTEISIADFGGNGWRIAQNAAQYIKYNGLTSTVGVGGYIEWSGVNHNEGATLKCVIANNGWIVVNTIGTLVVF